MTAQETPSRFEIGFMIGEGASPNPGECILPGRGLVGSEKPLLLIPKVANANLVMMAAKGGTPPTKRGGSPQTKRAVRPPKQTGGYAAETTARRSRRT